MNQSQRRQKHNLNLKMEERRAERKVTLLVRLSLHEAMFILATPLMLALTFPFYVS